MEKIHLCCPDTWSWGNRRQTRWHACCCCWVMSAVSDPVRPHRQQPTRLPRPWDSPGKNTGVGHHFLLQCRKVKSEREVAQSCPTLCDPTDSSPPGSPVPGILQARTLEWVAIAFSNHEPSNKVLKCETSGYLYFQLSIQRNSIIL